jgi:hypothetical protein
MRPPVTEVIVKKPEPEQSFEERVTTALRLGLPRGLIVGAEAALAELRRRREQTEAQPLQSERNAGGVTKRFASIPSLPTLKPYRKFLSASALRKLVRNADANGLGGAIIRAGWGNTYIELR